ncbi:MAG: lipase family protein [Sphaerospermopsis sp. SIO1G2]|nr:lipase family protein [Sphaerospermopsis sp. SIO1G1]NET70579.1 lipase family protein [Sphaerospermopsis sp. SIO1G2]
MKVDYAKALKLAISAKECYEDFATVVFSEWDEKPFFINQENTDTQLAIFNESSAVTIIFRGSDSYTDWVTNLSTKQRRVEVNQQVVKGQIIAEQEKIYPYSTNNKSKSLLHKGFSKSYFSVREEIHNYIKNNNVSSLTITGHSLGGALSIICAVDLQYNFGNLLTSIETYTFGAPKVGNQGFCQSYNQRVPKSYHFIHGLDLIPALPRWWQGYSTTKTQLRICPPLSWNFVSARFKDHKIINYVNYFQEKLKSSGN